MLQNYTVFMSGDVDKLRIILPKLPMDWKHLKKRDKLMKDTYKEIRSDKMIKGNREYSRRYSLTKCQIKHFENSLWCMNVQER